MLIDDSTETILPGYLSQIAATSGKEDRVPCWLNAGLFYLVGLLFCSCPLRVLFRRKSRNHNFAIRKEYFVDPYGVNAGNVTVNIIGNQGTINIDNDTPCGPTTSINMEQPHQQGHIPNAPPPPSYTPYKPPPPYGLE